MQIYFVRHGETESNVNGHIQGYDDQLTEQGKAQGKALAERLKEAKPEIIFSSPMPRAFDTAHIIADITGVKVEVNALLEEKKVPTSLVGLHSTDEKVAEANKLRKEQLALDTDWVYEDEEAFSAIKQRALDALNFLKTQSYERVVVVTHGTLLSHLLVTMVFGNDVDFKLQKKMSRSFKMSNVGVTVCQYRAPSEQKKEKWSIISWNDVAHLNS